MASRQIVSSPEWTLAKHPDGSWTFSAFWKSTGGFEPQVQDAALERVRRLVQSLGGITVDDRREATDGEVAPE
jgi:hypothetical protein